MDFEQPGFTRRDFLRTTAIGAAATGMSGSIAAGAEAAAAAAKKPTLPYGTLGKTKYPVTLVSFGAILISDKLGTRVVKAGIDAGMNLLHTAAGYTRGKSVQAIGELFKSSPEYRKKVLLCLKSFTPDKETELTDMLKILNTDHADVLLSTMKDADQGRLETIQKAQTALKAKGLIKHTGFVCHDDMNGVIEMVLEKAPSFFDVTLLSTALLDGSKEKKDRFVGNLAALRKKGVGIMSMKSGARKAIQAGADKFGPHVKDVLAAGCDTVLTSIDTYDQVALVKTLKLKSPATPADAKAAAEFRQSREGACLMCGDCAKACPRGIPVCDLMRIRLYNDEYGWTDHARSEYELLGANLGQRASGCGDCTACARVCPVKLASSANVQRITSLFA